MSEHYAIQSLEEARAYLEHPVLGARLLEAANAVLDIEGRTANDIFGRPDDIKLRSSVTLFATVTEEDSVFKQLLTKCFSDRPDPQTIRLLERQS